MRHTMAMASSIFVFASFAKAADVDVVATQVAFNATYGVATLPAGNTTWTADNTYILTDRVFVPNGSTLTIEPGTKIYSTFDNKGTTAANQTGDDTVGSVIVARGGQIFAEGTAAKPIVFDALQTLEAEIGQDLPYDTDSVIGVAGNAPGRTDNAFWGGVIILGNASISLIDAASNAVRNDVIEGNSPASAVNSYGDAFSDILEYGYDGLFAQDDADNSGVFRYVSIRHGGYNFAANNEINGLTLGGVGSGTTIDHVEVYANEDDGVEFFGGTVNTSHMVVAFCEDDSFDIDQGHSGTHQFWFALQDRTTGGDNLGEWDGIDTNNSGPTSTPASALVVAPSSPQIYNATFIGSGPSGSAGEDHGMALAELFNGSVFNSIITDTDGKLANFTNGGGFGGTLGDGFANNIVGSFGDYVNSNANVIGGTAPANFYQVGGVVVNGNTDAQTNPSFISYTRNGSFDVTALDPRLSTLNTTVSTGAPLTALYRGAFGGTNSENWAAGWTKLNSEGALLIDTDLDGTYDGTDTDDDGDGLADTLELEVGSDPLVADSAVFVAGVNGQFTAGQTSVTADPNAFSLYTLSNIQDLSADDIIVQKSVDNVATLSIPVESSVNLVPPFSSVGNATLVIPNVPADKQFYRFRVAP